MNSKEGASSAGPTFIKSIIDKTCVVFKKTVDVDFIYFFLEKIDFVHEHNDCSFCKPFAIANFFK